VTENTQYRTCREILSSSVPGAALVFVLALTVFAPSLWHGFVWDDHQTIVQTQEVLKPHFLGDVFSKIYFLRYRELSYRPVVTLSYFADNALWGRDPLGYHLINVLLHSTAVALGFLWLRLVSRRRWLPLIAAALFAVHPIQSEVVNVPSFREDILCAVFILISLILHEIGRSRKISPLLSIAVAVSYALALFSKETALLLVPGIMIMRAVVSRRDRPSTSTFRSECFRIIPLAAVAVAYAIVRFLLMRFPGESGSEYLAGSFGATLALLPRLLVEHVRLLIFPFGLHAERTLGTSPSIIVGWVCFAPILALTLFTLTKIRHARVSVAWFALALLPVMNFVPLANPVAERYLYMPSLGFIFSVVAFFDYMITQQHVNVNLRRIASTTIIASTLTVFVCHSFGAGSTLETDLSLWRNVLVHEPVNAKARNNLALTYDGHGEVEKAIQQYETNTQLHPENVYAQRSLGRLYQRGKRYEDAQRRYESALHLKPDSPRVHFLLGTLCEEQVRLEEALEWYRKSASLNITSAKAHLAVGSTLVRLGRSKEAIYPLNLAAQLSPNNFDVHLNLAVALHETGQRNTALRALQRANQLVTSPEQSSKIRRVAALINRMP